MPEIQIDSTQISIRPRLPSHLQQPRTCSNNHSIVTVLRKITGRESAGRNGGAFPPQTNQSLDGVSRRHSPDRTRAENDLGVPVLDVDGVEEIGSHGKFENPGANGSKPGLSRAFTSHRNIVACVYVRTCVYIYRYRERETSGKSQEGRGSVLVLNPELPWIAQGSERERKMVRTRVVVLRVRHRWSLYRR